MYDGATPGHSPAHPSKIFSSLLRNTLTASWTAASAATGSDHQGDAVVALHVLCAASVAALGLGFSLPLRLAPIVVILARHCGQHVDHMPLSLKYRPVNWSACAWPSSTTSADRGRMLRRQLVLQHFPIGSRKARQPIDLFHKQDFAGVRITDQPAQLRGAPAFGPTRPRHTTQRSRPRSTANALSWSRARLASCSLVEARR